jgi:hypothetical protein
MKNLFFGLAFTLVGTLAFASSNVSKITADDNRANDCMLTVERAAYLIESCGGELSGNDAETLYFSCMGY